MASERWDVQDGGRDPIEFRADVGDGTVQHYYLPKNPKRIKNYNNNPYIALNKEA